MGMDSWDYRGKKKYLMGIILDPALAVFKFWFHEIFVVRIKYYYIRVMQFHEIFASTKIIIN